MFKYFNELINFLRDVMEDSNCAYKLNEAFEEKLFRLINLIPQIYEDKIISLFATGKLFLMSINFQTLKDNADNLPLNLFIKLNKRSIDICKAFVNGNTSGFANKYIIEMVDTCEPLFDCFDELWKDPKHYIKRICDLKIAVPDVF